MRIKKTSQYMQGGAGLPSYFTDEIDTGMKWIDGKSIYRKVYVYTTLANQYNIDTGANEIISINGMINRKDYTNIYLPVGGRANETTWTTSFGNIQTISANRINFNYGSSWTSSTFNKLIVILEYTKTTD